eukprot:15430324-Alexandrium_andersonii.AAC.1
MTFSARTARPMSNLLQSAGFSGPEPESVQVLRMRGARSGPRPACADPLGSSLAEAPPVAAGGAAEGSVA